MRFSLRFEFVLRAVTYRHVTDSGFTGRLKPVPHIATKTAYFLHTLTSADVVHIQR